MADLFYITTKCDRCGRVIEHRELSVAEAATHRGRTDDTPAPAVMDATLEGIEPVRFSTLCDKCRSRCATLIEALRVGGRGRACE